MAKIQLSPDELELMQNSDLILTKNRILEKINQGLGGLQERMQPQVRKRKLIHEGIDSSGAKISRGEKYLGLPYLILDYPRLFDKDNILAIRTFFWWGSFCSVTLHVKGIYQLTVSRRLLTSFSRLEKKSMFVSFSGDEWSHDVNSTNYSPLQNLNGSDLSDLLNQAAFLKVTTKVEFEQWDVMEEKLFADFLALLQLVEA